MKYVIIFFSFFLMGIKLHAQKPVPKQTSKKHVIQKKKKVTIVKKGSERTLVGGVGKRGCVTTAGYSWSYALQGCIRWWEDGYKINDIDGKFVGYATLSDDGQAFELNLNTTDSIVLLLDKPNQFINEQYVATIEDHAIKIEKDGHLMYQLAQDASKFPAANPNILPIGKLDVQNGLGQKTFSLLGVNIFYFDDKTHSGEIKIAGKNYTLNKSTFTKGKKYSNKYHLSGSDITIDALNCSFQQNKGEDCNYGTIKKVTITVEGKTMYLANVHVQDCPNW